MNTQTIYRVFCLFALASSAGLALPATTTRAAILGPYAVDANTVNLWHMNDSTNPPSNAVGGGLSIVPEGAGPGTMGYAAYDGTFGTAGRTNRACCSNPNTSEERGWRADGVTPADVVGSNNGAFTIELLINFADLQDNNYFEIFRDSTTGLRARYEFSGGFDLIHFTVPGSGFSTVTSSNFLNEGTWYHMAFVYDGVGSSGNNARIYVTDMNPFYTQALLAGSANVSGGSYTFDNFWLGGPSGGQVNALFDEVRISNIARAADDMMFGTAPVPEPSSVVLTGLGLIGLAGWGLRRRASKQK